MDSTSLSSNINSNIKSNLSSGSNTTLTNRNTLDNEQLTIFWNNEVWKSNTNNIYNKKIVNVLEEIQKLQKIIKPSIKTLSNRYYFDIKNDSKLLNQIEKIKNDNINYIKIHAESIPEYHILIIKLKEELMLKINNKITNNK
jgi:hypothetical protein